MKYYYELFLTKDKIELDDWDNLFNEISRLNGILRSWKLYLNVEENMIRFYISSRVKIPSILSCSSSFVLRNINSIDTIHKTLRRMHFCMSSDKTFSDIYDKFESKKNKVLKQIEIKFRLLV